MVEYILPRSKAEIAQQSGVNVRRDLMKKYGFEKNLLPWMNLLTG